MTDLASLRQHIKYFKCPRAISHQLEQSKSWRLEKGWIYMAYFVRTRTGPEDWDSWKWLCARGVEGRDSTEIYAEVWNHMSSAYRNWAKAGGTVHKIQPCEKNQLTLIKLPNFAELSQPTRFAKAAEAVATSPFVSFLSASPPAWTRYMWGASSPGLNPLLGKGAPLASTQALTSAREESGTKRCHPLVLFRHVQPWKKQPQSPSGTIDKECQNPALLHFSLFPCMSSPSMPKRDLACKSLISMHTRDSPVLVGLSEKQMHGNCNPCDITSSVCGYPDISVISDW